MSPDDHTPASISAETYFATQPPPPSLEAETERVRSFVAQQIKKGRKIAFVTSGGTTVPLELNVVRFLDNFSAGTRGATSAEYFLEAGYAVLFMHRQFSLQPFSRHYSHSTNPFLDFLDVDLNSSSYTTSSDSVEDTRITVKASERKRLLEVLSTYKRVQEEETLLTLTFVTVNDYLWLLRAVSQELSKAGKDVMFYLAAAVSDFFLPRQKMSEHKIQSGAGSLHIEMDQIPKIIKPMVDEWHRDAFVVSFKLETDKNLLIPKSCAALERYGHQVVIGNDLHRRKFEVVFVSPRGQTKASPALSSLPSSSSTTSAPSLPVPVPIRSTTTGKDFEETWLRIDPAEVRSNGQPREIEEDIVRELVRRHAGWVEVGPR
ncbi:DFP-domain-containing protein [Pterulicium gracile]|uniref:DFP-domain-containing protein n=1 Tax=Pterulicium gracile TaxID=1884261 RepID=A0A5C3QA18_9AGAR|nr:DFP-domain-containing protein [Pterula gracilis]